MIMRYWNLKDGTLKQGTKLEYYCFKLQQLKERKEELNEEFYRNKISEYLEKIKKELML